MIEIREKDRERERERESVRNRERLVDKETIMVYIILEVTRA